MLGSGIQNHVPDHKETSPIMGGGYAGGPMLELAVLQKRGKSFHMVCKRKSSGITFQKK